MNFLKPGDRVRWKKINGRRVNQLAFLAMSDVVMEVIKKHPVISWEGKSLWLLRGVDGHEDWIPEDEVYLI